MKFWHLFRTTRPRHGIPSLPVGESRICLAEESGRSSDMLSLYCYRPAAWTTTAPVWIAFHGQERNGLALRHALTPLAEQYGFFLACPDMTEKKYPGPRYFQTGNVSDQDEVGGTLQPKATWTFSIIDRTIEELQRRIHRKGDLVLFGHSAGAQFLQRYALLFGTSQATQILVANSGWFTCPDRHIPYPYGIGELPLSDETPRRAFALPLTLLVGEEDTVRDKPFRRTPHAEAQGQNRLERNQFYFQYCKQMAESMGTPFAWSYRTIPGVGHHTKKMAAGAATLIYGEGVQNEKR